MKIGDPLDESTTLGPLSSKDALDTLSKQVDEAVKNGAKLHLGGKAVAREGNFFEPTILTGITRDNPAYFEEFFGPVAQIYVVKTMRRQSSWPMIPTMVWAARCSVRISNAPNGWPPPLKPEWFISTGSPIPRRSCRLAA